MKRAIVLLTMTSALAFLLGYSTIHAARSSKPKEIVVVGSKVKEVIKEAGLRSDGELVQVLSDRVIGAVRDAMRRAAWNHRRELEFHDLTCWADVDTTARTFSDDGPLIKPGFLKKLIRERGFHADLPMLEAINAKTWLILEDAIQRTKANKRQTVRAHDF